MRIDTLESRGSSPLHLAVKFGSLDNAKLLLDNGAEVGLRDAAGQTAVILAARHDLTGKTFFINNFEGN